VHQTLPQHDPGSLIEPYLADIEHQQYRGELREHHELSDKARYVFVGECIVEGPIPRIEADLHGCGRGNHDDEPAAQQQQLVALARSPEGTRHPLDLGEEVILGEVIRSEGIFARGGPGAGRSRGAGGGCARW